MSTVLIILGSLFISFWAILFILALEVISIKNGHRPDWGFVIPAGLLAFIPILNIVLILIFGLFLIKDFVKESGYLLKIENCIIKLIRGNNE